MALREHTGGGLILFSFITALLLTIVVLPDWARPARPELVPMLLIYWCLMVPERVGVGTSWLIGLMMDVALGALLGQHALAYALIAWIPLKACCQTGNTRRR